MHQSVRQLREIDEIAKMEVEKNATSVMWNVKDTLFRYFPTKYDIIEYNSKMFLAFLSGKEWKMLFSTRKMLNSLVLLVS